MPINTFAAFDSLLLADRIENRIGSFAPAEIHIFAYLACLLWLYRRRAVTDWGYGFVATELGAPFSVEIDSSVKQLLEGGSFERVEHRMVLGDSARRSLQVFAEMGMNRDRSECLSAALASTAALSVGMVSTAVVAEPDLKRAKAFPSTRRLLEEPARTQLYAQFQALWQGIGEQNVDLRLPAVVWLTALYESSQAAS